MGITCSCLKSKSNVMTKMVSFGVVIENDITDVNEVDEEEDTFCSKHVGNYVFKPIFFKQQAQMTEEKVVTQIEQQENDNNSKNISPITLSSHNEEPSQNKSKQQSQFKLDKKRGSLEQRFLVSPSQIKRMSLQQKNANKIILFPQSKQSQEQREKKILLQGTKKNEKDNQSEKLK